MQYVFILGHNPKLSVAEILAVLPPAKIIAETGSFLIIENDDFDCAEVLSRLGGTIKVGKIIGNQISRKVTVEKLKALKKETKLNFGISYYEAKPDNFGMEIKKDLKEAGISCRLVTSKDKALSSVVVSKNQCAEFLVLGNKWLGETCAVQEFEEYSKRDFGRPVRDLLSGSMPPKLAKIMINLAQLPRGATILDPFCGSGTVLQEGLLLGYKMIGSDISDKAVKDTKKNLEWLLKITNSKSHLSASAQGDPERSRMGQIPNKFQISNSKFQIIKADVKQISKYVQQVDAVVTEPYLGPPLRGSEDRKQISEIVEELSKLYDAAFGEFRKILNPGSKVVIIFPAFRLGKEVLELPVLPEIKKLGFTQLNKDKLVYSREGQKVWRQIYVFQR
ncbi:MAG: DNA methyltransferase [Patescibacteria group bacterium]|jgi:tRNA G10  N-methylase Trm11